MRARLSRSEVAAFRKKIYGHYKDHGRILPWRKRISAYRVLVSEIMLQQTQVEHVTVKFNRFLLAFPDFRTLALSRTADLLAAWSGLGYNRRALALRSLAVRVMNEYGGRLPQQQDLLLALPGIGTYTAGAVLAFAFNKPVVFIDTNVRRVYIHEFFPDRNSIHDDELRPLLERTMDRKNPRKWYNALMDYGAMLKRHGINPNRRSAHYVRQSPFESSNRKVRGKILKMLLQEPVLTRAQIGKRTGMDAEQTAACLRDLEREGFIRKNGRAFELMP